MQDIAYYTNLILSPEIQTLISPYRDIFILISLFFLCISLLLIFQEKYFVSDIKRRALDFFSDTKDYRKPQKFVAMWKKIEKYFKKEDYKNMIIIDNNLMFEILKRFSYVGNDLKSIIDSYGIKEGAFPNIENVKRISELKKSIQEKKDTELQKEEMLKIFELSKDTLIKIGILNK